MSVRAILEVKGRRVVTVRSATPVKEVVATMASERIGAVVVSNDGETFAGILSERDIIQAMARFESKLLELTASDLMTRAVTAASIDMQIDEVLDLMTQGRFRHMPVLEDDRLAGLVSIGDAVKARLERLESETTQLKEYIGGL